MINDNRIKENGSVNGWMIASIGAFVAVIIISGLAIWSYVSYTEQKTDVDSKISDAVSSAVNAQRVKDDAKFLESEKMPNRQFVGPDDYGRVTFDYPKTWSVYIAKDATSGGSYEAYLNPVTVPTVNSRQQYSARVLIEQKDYDKVISGYDSLVKKGDLKSSSVTADGINGTRMDGSFTKDIRGSAVIFKIRDKTLTIRTDAETFSNDFNKLITTIKFNR